MFFSKVILDNGAEVSLLPYGIQKEFKTKCLIGNGVVIDPKVLLSDFNAL
jgi:adenylosuccinate synthase